MGLKRPFEKRDLSKEAMLQRLRENLYRKAAPAPPPKRREAGWIIGVDRDGGDFVVPYRELFDSHVHCIGRTGWGKSFLLYSLICQSILAGHGVVVIDPDGPLYEMVLNFLVLQGVDPERVTLINAQSARWTPKLNPLQSWGGRAGMGTDVAAGALLLAAGDSSFEGMPRLRKYVRGSCTALEKGGLPLAILPWFLAMAEAGAVLRNQVVGKVNNPYIKLIWEEFQSLNRHDKQEHLDSTINRVTAYAEDDGLCRMMAFAEGNLDWKEQLDGQKIVLCNLGQDSEAPLKRDDLRLLGGLLVHGIVHAGYRRKTGQGRHTFVFCDEFSEFLSEEVAQGLARLRKREVHFVLAHQTIAQIEEESRKLYSAVENCCGIRLVFGGMGRGDTERVAKDLYTGQVHGEHVKHRVSSVGFRPLIRWVDIVTESGGGAHSVTHAEGHGVTDTESGGSTYAASRGSGRSVLYTPDRGIIFWDDAGVTETTSFQEASSESVGWSRSESYSESTAETDTESWARSVSRVPMTVYEEFAQPPQLTFYTLEEQWEKVYGRLMNLPRRTVAVKVGTEPAVIVPTLAIEEEVAPASAIRAYEEEVCRICPYVVETELAAERFASLLVECGFSGEEGHADVLVASGILGELPAPPPVMQVEARPVAPRRKMHPEVDGAGRGRKAVAKAKGKPRQRGNSRSDRT